MLRQRPLHQGRNVCLPVAYGGKAVRHRLTVPEGLTSAEIVAIVNGTPELEGGPEPAPAEGSLLPETYFFSLGDKRVQMVERMEHAFSKTLAELWAERGSDLPFASPAEAVTLASIVEKETGREEERPHGEVGVDAPLDAAGDAHGRGGDDEGKARSGHLDDQGHADRQLAEEVLGDGVADTPLCLAAM